MQTHTVPFGAAANITLRDLVAHAKSGNPLAPVTILVRDNIAAISLRRALAHGVGGRRGVAAINVLTLRRFGEQLLAAMGETRPPVTSAWLTAVWRRELTSDPGCFAPVAQHTATVRALVRAHGELREVDDSRLDSIAESSELAADLVRMHRRVTASALGGRRDEVAVLRDATGLVRAGINAVAGFGAVVLHLPDELAPSERDFARALDESVGLVAVIGRTGARDVDEPLLEFFSGEALDGTREGAEPVEQTAPQAGRILHASDSDDEVRAIVREVRALLIDGVPAHRIAVLYPVAVPYARLLQDHLSAAGLISNGPGVRPLRDRAIADSFLTLLALDPDDLQRVAFFDWLGRAPIRLGDGGASVPRTRWERLSREAGITVGDWSERLAGHEARHQARLDADRDNPDTSAGSLAYRERSIAETQAFSAFVAELRHRLTEGGEPSTWAALGDWALGLFHRYLGRTEGMGGLPEEEQRAANAIEVALGGLAELDGLGSPSTLTELVEILEVDLDSRRPRVGRFGDGVFVGPITSAPSLDVDHIFTLGLSEDLYPGRGTIDPLLPDAVRELAAGQLPTSRDRRRTRQRALLAAFGSGAQVTASFPRGDLRRGAERLPSRWLMPTLRTLTDRPDLEATRWAEASSPDLRSVASHWEGITHSQRPGTAQEWRLRRLSGGDHLDGDTALDGSLELIRARRSDAFTRFDGNLDGVAGLPDYADGTSLISPTALEQYASCPHAFFVERLLGVSPLDSPEEIITIRPWDLGSIVHEVLDRLVIEATDLPGFGEPWGVQHRARMRDLAGEVMADFERRGLTGHPRLWEREREQLGRDLELVLDLDDQAHATRDSRVVASELPFGIRGHAAVRIDVEGGVIVMRGSADRVDETRDGTLIVTDFKTGSARGFTDFAKDPVVAGTKLQLPLYAHAARTAFGNSSVEAAYWFIGRKDRGKRVEVVLDDDLEQTYRRALGTLAGGIRDGSFIARPPATDDFAWVQCAFCNPDGVGYGHVRSASERKRTDVSLASLYALLDPSVLSTGALGATDSGGDPGSPTGEVHG